MRGGSGQRIVISRWLDVQSLSSRDAKASQTESVKTHLATPRGSPENKAAIWSDSFIGRSV